jgi:hypothetical protein
MSNTLGSNIFVTGTKFIVKDNTVDNVLAPGTTGRIICAEGEDEDYDNVVFMSAVITRRGKSGKERLEITDLSIPVFEIDGDMSKIMPDEKRRNFVHISPIKENGSVLDFSDIDFLSWALSYSRYVKKLNSLGNVVDAWPKSNKNMLNAFSEINLLYSDFPNEAKETANNVNRLSFVQQIRLLEATLVKCSLSYLEKMSYVEIKAIKSLISNSVGNSAINKATKFEIEEKRKSLKLLIEAKRKANIKA